MTLEELTLGYDRLSAAAECKNLVGIYASLLSENRTREITDLWAKRDDCTLVMPWGCYDGIEGVRRCFTVDHIDIDDVGAFEKLKGIWMMDSLAAECMEVAKDGQTAAPPMWRRKWRPIPPITRLRSTAKNHIGAGVNMVSILLKRTGSGKSGICVCSPYLKFPTLPTGKRLPMRVLN